MSKTKTKKVTKPAHRMVMVVYGFDEDTLQGGLSFRTFVVEISSTRSLLNSLA